MLQNFQMQNFNLKFTFKGGHSKKLSTFLASLIASKHTAFLLINPSTPVPPVTGLDEPWPFFHFYVITFDQNWHTQLLQGEKIFPVMPRSE